MKQRLLLTVILTSLAFLSCNKKQIVNTSFYYWKTVYHNNTSEMQRFNALHCRKIYLRIMDVDASDKGPIPVSSISFKSPIPDSVEVIPVVFIVNNVLKAQSNQQLNDLAAKIVRYATGKLKQADKQNFKEIQIDCDWTKTTRDQYFYLLTKIKANPALADKKLSTTLRLHQLKNQISSGIPPVDRVMLMCYNMGNLRKYGDQNSILEQGELEKYVGKNLSIYPMPVDVGLPLFTWAVVFRQKQYAGIAKRLDQNQLLQTANFNSIGNNLYLLNKDLPALGLKRNDEVRWERLTPEQLKDAAQYIAGFIQSNPVNIIYFHLDELVLKQYTNEDLEKTTAFFR
jgi:hypothetical protein